MAQHLTLVQAAWYAWIPPLLAAAGGLAGGWLSLRWIALRTRAPPPARFRVCLVAAVLSLATAAIPAAPNPPLGFALGISLSFFAVAGLQRQHVHPAARCLRRRPRGLRRLLAGRLLRRHPAGHLAALRLASSTVTATRPSPAIAALTPLAACAVLLRGPRTSREAAAQTAGSSGCWARIPRPWWSPSASGDADLVPAHGRRSARALVPRPPPFRGHAKRTGRSCGASCDATASAWRR